MDAEPGVGGDSSGEPSAGPADDGGDRPATDPPESLAEALRLRRNARIGLAAGLGLAGFLYLRTFRALDGAQPRGLYLGLALVLAATLAGVVAAALSAKAMLEPVLDRGAWLRRGGTAAIAGGLAVATLPLLAWVAGADLASDAVWRVALALACLSLAVGATGLHAAVHGGPPRGVERVAYWIVAGGFLLAAGNASGSAAAVASTDAGPLATPFLVAGFLASAAAIPFAAALELVPSVGAGERGALQSGREPALQSDEEAAPQPDDAHGLQTDRASAPQSGDAPAPQPGDAHRPKSGDAPVWQAGDALPVQPRGTRALLVGSLLAVVGVAWLLLAGGWGWVASRIARPNPLALAVLATPAGLGWAAAGVALRSAAADFHVRPAGPRDGRDRVDD